IGLKDGYVILGVTNEPIDYF
ncbi:RNA-binding protein, partial [Streptococcus agalactiae]|nr:RNA-binding protein [Streptococcus agalactiae]